MSATAEEVVGAQPEPGQPDPRRWVTLAVIAIAQLMVVLDGSKHL